MFHLRRRGKLSSFHTDVLAFPTTRRGHWTNSLWNVERPGPFSRPLCVGISLFQPRATEVGACRIKPANGSPRCDITPHMSECRDKTVIRMRSYVRLRRDIHANQKKQALNVMYLPNHHRSSWLLLNIRLHSRTHPTTHFKSAITLGISRPTITIPLVSRCFIRHGKS